MTSSPRRCRGWFAAVLLIAMAGFTAAADPSLEVKLDPQRLGVEDNTRLVVVIREPGQRNLTPRLGGLENFAVVAGPSTENRFMFVNGVSTSELAVTYVLQPQTVGPASVGPVTVQVGSVALRSDVLTAEVVAGSLAPARPTRRSRFPFNDPFAEAVQPRPSSQAKIVVRQLVEEREIFLGQPIGVTLALDSNIAGVEGYEWVEAPSFPGWWTQPVEQPEELRPEIVEVGGERFQRYLIGQYVLVPLKAGELSLPAAKVRVGVRQRSFFSRQQVVERSSEAIKIEVLERPRAPEGYAGAVGSLRYRATLEPASIELGESAVLSITLEGRGNLPLVEAPAIWPTCADCDTYPPEDGIELAVDGDGMGGVRTWRQTMLPRSPGELHLEPVTLAVFDPVAGHYRRQTLGPLTLAVEPPPPTPEPTLPPEEAAAVATRAAESAGDRSAAGQAVSGGGLWLWLLVAIAAGAVCGGGVVWLILGRRRSPLPPRRSGQTPAERARDLQVALERWWVGVRESAAGNGREAAMDQLRRDLETVRFAPGRADHTETIHELERRVGQLLRQSR